MADDAMTDAELRVWAEKVKAHSAAARGVLRLLDSLQPQPIDMSNPPVFSMSTDGKFRRNGMVIFDGSTGTPPHGRAGHKSEGSGT